MYIIHVYCIGYLEKLRNSAKMHFGKLYQQRAFRSAVKPQQPAQARRATRKAASEEDRDQTPSSLIAVTKR